MSVKEKILSKDEELSASEEPLLLDKDYNPENIVNTSSSIEDDLERQLASFLEKEEAFKKNELSADRISLLEEVDGWVWGIKSAQWEERYGSLLVFAEQEGHLLVNRVYRLNWICTW